MTTSTRIVTKTTTISSKERQGTMTIEEGDACPFGCEGKLGYPKAEDCSCHLNAPCGACVSVVLTCPECGWEDDGQPLKPVPIGVSPEWRKWYRDNSPPWNSDLGNGKRLIEWSYSGRSGSTMEYKGRFDGPVTAKDVLEHFGDGTFGHRGPTLIHDIDRMSNVLPTGKFTYTKITD